MSRSFRALILLAVSCFTAMLFCADDTDPTVLIGSAVFRMGRVSSYIEAIPRFEGKYPEEAEVIIGGRMHYVLPERYVAYPPPEDLRYTNPPIPPSPPKQKQLNPIFIDPFQSSTTYQYLSNGAWFLLICAGPDAEYNEGAISKIRQQKESINEVQIQDWLSGNLYDPTNGLLSSGDIIFSSSNLLLDHERMGKIYLPAPSEKNLGGE